MPLEVEQKYRVDDLAAIATRLVELGAKPQPAVRQVDAYFAHPSRDFAQTDEALRLRRVGDRNVITYKGPKLDLTTKTRREIELPLADGGPSYQSWAEMLSALGFSLVREVTKTRTTCLLATSRHEIEVALDLVDGVGSFVELEMAADESSVDAAREMIAEVATQLELQTAERRSYLELLLLTEASETD
ncbi:MAG: class IV adenylate cyclase [Planctomycetota bacterium]